MHAQTTTVLNFEKKKKINVGQLWTPKKKKSGNATHTAPEAGFFSGFAGLRGD